MLLNSYEIIFLLPVHLNRSSLSAFSSRTVPSSTSCSKTLSTSGLPVRPERSAPSSRSFTTPASATARHGDQSSSTVSPSCWGVRRFKKKKERKYFVTRRLYNDGLNTVLQCRKPVRVFMHDDTQHLLYMKMHAYSSCTASAEFSAEGRSMGMCRISCDSKHLTQINWFEACGATKCRTR